MNPLRLDPLPPTFQASVATLHRVAEEVLAPPQPGGEIALMATPGGFGTPVFDRDRQVRVEGIDLVHAAGAEERREPLDVDAAAAARLAGWYAFGDAVLTAFVALAAPEDAPTPIRLWPEHFDLAIELGPEPAGRRANYGFSPGDAQHAEPYAYVGPWTAEVHGELWRANGFSGAELSYAELLAAPDQHAAALAFLTSRHAALTAAARSEA